MGKTSIGWTDNSLNFYSWNCMKVSEGCSHCYAEAMATQHGKEFRGVPVWREKALDEYRALKPGESAFVNDMSDTFIQGVPLEYIERLFSLFRQKPLVQFLLLTKRIERVASLVPFDWFAPNVWIGTSIENRKRLGRLEILKQLHAYGKFVSVEPLLESLGDVNWTGIQTVLVGGESGMERRPFDKTWARTIRDQCVCDQVDFYFKQGSDFRPGQDRILDGQTYDSVSWRNAGDNEESTTQPSLF